MEQETLNIKQAFSILQLCSNNDTTHVNSISIISGLFWLNFERFLLFNVRSEMYNN